MKNIINYTLVLCFVFTTASCSSDDNNDLDNSDDGSFFVKINGIDYIPDDVTAFTPLGANVTIDASMLDNTQVFVIFPISNLLTGEITQVGDTFTVANAEFFADYTIGNADGVDATQGSVTITAHNPNEKTISGTFSFTTETDSTGTSYAFTEGTFNLSYDIP